MKKMWQIYELLFAVFSVVLFIQDQVLYGIYALLLSTFSLIWVTRQRIEEVDA